MDLGENELVIEALEGGEEGVDEGDGGLVLLGEDEEGDEAGFEGVGEEETFFGVGPGDIVAEDGDLGGLGVGDGGEVVEECSD